MKRLICAVLMLITSACASPPLTSVATAETYVYKMGSGDRLRITTFGEPALSGDFAVTGTGVIAFPLIGDTAAAGRTQTELRDEITAKLGARFLRDPKVSVEVVNYRPVFVLGEVAKPGDFPYVERMSVYALIAKAGGFTFRANRKIVYIRHETETDEKAYALTGTLSVQPGDTVRIGERYL